MENLARKYEFKQDPEEEQPPAVDRGESNVIEGPWKKPEAVTLPEVANDNELEQAPSFIHPEAANDNEIVQPISTIYPEAANDNAPVISAEDQVKLQDVWGRLNEFKAPKVEAEAIQNSEQPVTEGMTEDSPVRNAESITSAAETTLGKPETNRGEGAPDPARSAGGERRRGSGGGGVGGGKSNAIPRPWEEKKPKSILVRLLKLPIDAIKLAWKGVLLMVATGLVILQEATKLSLRAFKLEGKDKAKKS